MRLFNFTKGNRRTAPRHLGSHCVTVYTNQARVGEAQIVDQSSTGAKLAWKAGRSVPASGVMFDPRSSRVSAFRRVWQQGGYVGVRFTRTQDARGLVAPEFQFLKPLLAQARTRTVA